MSSHDKEKMLSDENQANFRFEKGPVCSKIGDKVLLYEPVGGETMPGQKSKNSATVKHIGKGQNRARNTNIPIPRATNVTNKDKLIALVSKLDSKVDEI